VAAPRFMTKVAIVALEAGARQRHINRMTTEASEDVPQQSPLSLVRDSPAPPPGPGGGANGARRRGASPAMLARERSRRAAATALRVANLAAALAFLIASLLLKKGLLVSFVLAVGVWLIGGLGLAGAILGAVSMAQGRNPLEFFRQPPDKSDGGA
jgi:hypothetical protein